ncbi:hypothetical protein STCU_09967 [Strigomonas culicis]|uniref:Uncharacterized protein n=1 Tax=Strigomonas culicis TaxID=28005 RepID=S9UVB7_9TRYP|nr:hypothetical protein STCU_09967 [Strigomonas culicis]|eukprot:EPY18456.1 hypothetical protein STCU_09967 [Strigomonas culicis]
MTAMTQANHIQDICGACVVPAHHRDYNDGNGCTIYPGDSVEDEKMQRLSNEPTSGVERCSSTQWRQEATTDNSKTNGMDLHGDKPKDGQFMRDVKALKRCVSTGLNSLVSTMKKKGMRTFPFDKKTEISNTGTEMATTPPGSRSNSCSAFTFTLAFSPLILSFYSHFFFFPFVLIKR